MSSLSSLSKSYLSEVKFYNAYEMRPRLIMHNIVNITKGKFLRSNII